MKIRTATVDDMPELLEGFEATYHNMGLDTIMAKYNPEKTEEFWSTIVTHENGVVFVAEEDGKIIGRLAAIVTPWPREPECLLSQCISFAVDKDHRRKGIGSELLRVFREWSLDKKATVMAVTTMNKAEGTAQMCVKRGFKLTESLYCKRL